MRGGTAARSMEAATYTTKRRAYGRSARAPSKAQWSHGTHLSIFAPAFLHMYASIWRTPPLWPSLTLLFTSRWPLFP